MCESVAEERQQTRAYLAKLKAILTAPGSNRPSAGPGQLLDHLYIGSRRDATDRSLLRRLRITHVLNCAASPDYSAETGRLAGDNPYADDNIAYREFEAHDNAGYPILMHLARARQFIDEAKRQRGRVLVHCEMGVNRSGALCIAYMMLDEHITLLQAVRRVKYDRPVVLCNEGFQRQLIDFAREQGLLHYRGSHGVHPAQ